MQDRYWRIAALMVAGTLGVAGCSALNPLSSSAIVTTGSSSLSVTGSNGSTYATQGFNVASLPTASSKFGGVSNVADAFLTIDKLQVHYAGAADPTTVQDATSSAPVDSDPSWVTVSTASTTLDLGNLSTDSPLGGASLRNGTYTQIRAVVTGAYVKFSDGSTASLDVSGGDLRIVKPFVLKPGYSTTLHFDFNTAHSFVDAGGTYRMNPTAVHVVPTQAQLPSANASASPSPSPSPSSSPTV